VLGNDSEALEGLRRSEVKLQDYADGRGLILREEHPWPGYAARAAATTASRVSASSR
jgi:hypothetical protein